MLGDKVNYPGKAKKEYNKYTTYGNRGMGLEELLNESNKYYLDEIRRQKVERLIK